MIPVFGNKKHCMEYGVVEAISNPYLIVILSGTKRRLAPH